MERALVGLGTHKMLLAHDGDGLFSELQTDEEVAFSRDALSGGRGTPLLVFLATKASAVHEQCLLELGHGLQATIGLALIRFCALQMART